MISLKKLFQQRFEGHRGRLGKVGGSLARDGGDSSAKSKDEIHSQLGDSIRFNPNGRSIVARGGSDKIASPMFFTTNPGMAMDYSDDGKRGLYTFSIDMSKVIVVDSQEWGRNFGYDISEELAQDLYTDTPEDILSKVRSLGYSGISSNDGEYIRLDEPKKAGARFHRGWGHLFGN